MNLKFIESFNQKKTNGIFKSLINFYNNLSKKQKYSLLIPIISLFSLVIYASSSSGGGGNFYTPRTINEILEETGVDLEYRVGFIAWTGIIEIVKYAISYIAMAQISSIDIIAKTPLNGAGAFDNIINGLTIFACIGCFYKLAVHFLNTERFDNVKAYTGFFSYIAVFILFILSPQIVNRVISLNTNINTSNITNISKNIDTELNQMIKEDYILYAKEQKSFDIIIERGDFIDKGSAKIDKSINSFTFNIANVLKYIYYSFFGLLMTSVLAVPTVIMTLMVKIILSIMILGAKLVFLLAFIPGFENTWKTYMLNLLNVILWVPIFNIIMSFIIALMSAFMFTQSIGTGQIIWLSVVSLILAFQAISLTTTAASTIISGAGAGIGGALGGLNSMSGAAVIGGAAVATAGTVVATAGIIKASNSDKFS